jgi:23S rRNA (uracil1939-C5)-methyltransferase
VGFNSAPAFNGSSGRANQEPHRAQRLAGSQRPAESAKRSGAGESARGICTGRFLVRLSDQVVIYESVVSAEHSLLAREPHKQEISDAELEVLVERILPGGLGLAHADDRTVLVALAAPGDRLRVRIDRVKGNVSFASIREVIEPGPSRVDPPCPYFGRCGGCDFQQLNYQAQLDAKSEIIRDCLRRIGGFAIVPDFQITPAPNEWHYRSRAQWQHDAMRRRLGYFESGSHRVCDVAECAVLAPELQAELEVMRQRMQQGAIPDDARHFRAIVGDGEISIVDDHGRSPLSEARQAVKEITRTINGEKYYLNAASFFQANSDLMPQLIDSAIGEARGEMAIELYSGVGLFTLPLARRFKKVVGVESDARASDFARQSLAEANLSNAEIVNDDVADWLDQDLERGGRAQRRRRFGLMEERTSPSESREPIQDSIQSAVKAGALPIDFLLLDPPRVGAESRVIAGILILKPKKICYVSCDPATLARDLKKLTAGGYSIERMAAFDMFPQTHHVETVVHFQAHKRRSQ